MPAVVGMVRVTCPACADDVETDVVLTEVHTNGAYMSVVFDQMNPRHECHGRRS